MTTTTFKPSDLKVCNCGHLAHEHPTKVAPASSWRDKCSKCPCKRFKIAANKKIGDKWIPDTKVIVTKKEKITADRQVFLDWLNKPFKEQKPHEDPIVLRRIWP